MEEQWAEIEGFPDYAVSNHGQVINVRTNKILKPRDNSYGYLRVTLRRNGISYDLYIHHLVARTFTTGYIDGISVKHHDGDNANNHITNLRFSRDRGLGQYNKKTPHPRFRRVRIIETGHTFHSVEECAGYLDGDASSIYRVINGKRRSHKGYTFEYFYEGE